MNQEEEIMEIDEIEEAIEEEIADVMNYILNQWGNSSDDFVTQERVSQIQKSILE